MCIRDRVRPSPEVDAWLESKGSSVLKDGIFISDLIRRPELTINDLLSEFLPKVSCTDDLAYAVQVELKFAGYLSRQDEDIKRLKRMENDLIPEDFSFEGINGLRTEYVEKLKSHRPHSIAQAMKIPGITPTALSTLALYLKKHRSAA